MIEDKLKIKNQLPIGVFDSGVGGLTVLKALKLRLPNESFLYLGDTARLPYGTKSERTIAQYAKQAANYLYQQHIKMLVIACNTASAMALTELQQAFPEIPVIGVIEAGAQAAYNISKTGHIVVAATEATIANQAYQRAIQRLAPDATVMGQACSLFVALAEEGWLDGEVTTAVIKHYLLPYFNSTKQPQADCLLLGCTHFPAFLPALYQVLGDDVAIVDSAYTAAEAVAITLTNYHLHAKPSAFSSTVTYFATDAKERFVKVAQYFLQELIDPSHIHLVDIAAPQ